MVNPLPNLRSLGVLWQGKTGGALGVTGGQKEAQKEDGREVVSVE